MTLFFSSTLKLRCCLFWRTKVLFVVPLLHTPVLDFGWYLHWVSQPGWIPCFWAFLPVCNGFLIFTSGGTPADCRAQHGSKPFWPMSLQDHVSRSIGGVRTHDCACRSTMLLVIRPLRLSYIEIELLHSRTDAGSFINLGANDLGGEAGRQHMFLQNILKNCMKLKMFWSLWGGCGGRGLAKRICQR